MPKPLDLPTIAKLLTFRLGDETFGTDVMPVQEIVGLMPITRVPGMPPFFRGVVNLRGRLLPVIDMRDKLGMTAADATRLTCTVFWRIVRGELDLVVGGIVDEVMDVLDLRETPVEPAPALGAAVRSDLIAGMVRAADESIITVLDIARILTREELAGVAGTTAHSGE
jgi:purine-binding chemotaxis protein CheW